MKNPARGPLHQDIGTINGVVPRCPMCGTHGWERKIPDDLKADEPFDEALIATRNKQLLTMKVISFFCVNCGFARQHDIERYRP